MAVLSQILLSIILISIGYTSCATARVIPDRRGQTVNAEEIIGGFVFYRNIGGVIEYLLMEKRSEPGDWTSPKGHAENGESQLDAALRETMEETGFLYPEDYVVTIEYSESFEYETSSGDLKIVRLYPAELTNFNKPIVIGDELSQYKWLEFDDAASIIKKQYKTAFESANEYIKRAETELP